MKKKNWYRPKAFTHLTKKLTQDDGSWIKGYVSDPVTVARHKFYPLIHRTLATKRYKDSVDKLGRKVRRHYTFEDGRRKSNVKYREIYYPNHLDAHIYSYYTQKILEPLYEAELKGNFELDSAILAYRRIATGEGDRCKCNIDFANEVFDQIGGKKGEVAVMALDITKFFDSLDHKILKRAWVKLLGGSDLPKDHYNLFKSLTQFSYVDMQAILNEFGYKHPNELIQQKVSYFTTGGKDFRERIKSKGLIKKNPFRRRCESNDPLEIIGIPQGTPISAFLANLYLLNFDRKVLSLLQSYHGIYRRYSDDILVICPKEHAELIETSLYEMIQEFKLIIQKEKTQRIYFTNGRLNKGASPVVYLGFQFDGHTKSIKSASLSKFHRKMKSSIRYRAYRAYIAKTKREKGKDVNATLHRKKLYRQFSYLGAARTSMKKRNYFSYAQFAARVMDSPLINRQMSKAWGILHDEITKQEKRFGLDTL